MYSKFYDTMLPLFPFINTTVHKHFMVYGGCQKYAQAFATGPFVLQLNLSVIVLERETTKYYKDNYVVAPYQFVLFVLLIFGERALDTLIYPASIHFKINQALEVCTSHSPLLYFSPL